LSIVSSVPPLMRIDFIEGKVLPVAFKTGILARLEFS